MKNVTRMMNQTRAEHHTFIIRTMFHHTGMDLTGGDQPGGDGRIGTDGGVETVVIGTADGTMEDIVEEEDVEAVRYEEQEEAEALDPVVQVVEVEEPLLVLDVVHELVARALQAKHEALAQDGVQGFALEDVVLEFVPEAA
jgi:hypothetical protein